MTRYILLFIFFLVQVTIATCQTKISDFPIMKGLYLGQEPPGDVPIQFLPDIIKNVHSSLAFSPNGKKVFWKEMGNNKLLFMEEVNGTWTLPNTAPFSSLFYRQDVPFFSPDGKKLFFITTKPQKWHQVYSDEGIWYIEKKKDRWSSPKNVGSAINNIFTHWQFSVSAKGTIYFAGSEDENKEIWSIYKSRLVGSKYEKPVRLDSTINAISEPMVYAQLAPYISPDESYIIYCGLGREEAIGDGHNLYISYKTKDNTWTSPVNLSKLFDLNGGALCPIVSPDGKYLFFMHGHDGIKWVDARFIENLKPIERLK